MTPILGSIVWIGLPTYNMKARRFILFVVII